jgi:hypothetical protein
MIATTVDTQYVSETLSVLWNSLQQGPVSMLCIIKNSGANTMNYSIQECNGGTWQDMGTSGSDLQTTLQANEVKSLAVNSNYSQVRMVGNASGGALLEFTVVRYFNRASGGAIPLMSF